MSKRRQPAQVTPEETARWAARIVQGPEPERFYCPHPGCNRSFAELWRLKVHYRAPPDVRGSGKERGHGTELAFCPKCGKDLFPGKHHVGCIAGKSAPRQAAKRQRQIMAQSTTTEDGPTLDTAGTTASLEAVRRQASAKLASNDLSSSRQAGSGSQCRAEARQLSQATGELLFPSAADRPVVVGGSAGQGKQLLVPPAARAASAASIQAPGEAATAAAAKAGDGGTTAARHQAQVDALSELFLPHTELPTGSDLLLRAPSPLPLDGIGIVVDSAPRPASPFGALLRPPSPPPLPPEWAGAPGGAPLFDFDQFDINKRREQEELGMTAPLVTVTSAMQPQELHNPSDDYVWQILFAGENDPVPKRVTAHLHHPPEADDSLIWSDGPTPLAGWDDGATPTGAHQPEAGHAAPDNGDMLPPPAAAPLPLPAPAPAPAPAFAPPVATKGQALPGSGVPPLLGPTPLCDMLARDAAVAAVAACAGAGPGGGTAEEGLLAERKGAQACGMEGGAAPAAAPPLLAGHHHSAVQPAQAQ